EDGARHTGVIHPFQKVCGRERRGLVRPRGLTWRPRTLRRVSGPNMHLGIDDHHGEPLCDAAVSDQSSVTPARSMTGPQNPACCLSSTAKSRGLETTGSMLRLSNSLRMAGVAAALISASSRRWMIGSGVPSGANSAYQL